MTHQRSGRSSGSYPLPQGGTDPNNGWGTGTLPESLRDTGRGFWNAGIGIVEAVPNLLGGFAIPGAPDYVPFMAEFRAEYEAPKFGAIIEVLGTVGTLKVLGEIGAATRFSKDKEALVDMAKMDKRTGITSADMQAYKDLNQGLPDPYPTNKVRGPEAHGVGGAHSQQPHGHVGPVTHIPILDP